MGDDDEDADRCCWPALAVGPAAEDDGAGRADTNLALLALGQGGTAATGLIGLHGGGDLEKDGKYGTDDVIWWGRR